MRVRSGLLASLCVALAVTATAAAAPDRPKRTCAMKGSKTVLQASGIRLFTARIVDEDRVLLYGCLSANGHKQELADRYESDYDGTFTDFSDVRLAGHYVAWHTYEWSGACKADCSPENDQSQESVAAYDLRRERLVRQSFLADFTTYTRGSLAVTRHGGLVWLTPGTPGPQQLVGIDRDGRRVLDSGAIAAASVRAEISIVSWVRDGAEHFARLR